MGSGAPRVDDRHIVSMAEIVIVDGGSSWVGGRGVREEANNVCTLLCDVALASGRQANHYHADACVLHLNASSISFGRSHVSRKYEVWFVMLFSVKAWGFARKSKEGN